MKTIKKISLLVALGAALFVSSCAGTYYVTARPAEPVYERPVAPYEGAVWIPGEWVWNGNQYVHVRGHWERPRANRVYIAGHWDQGPRGYVWIKGYWR